MRVGKSGPFFSSLTVSLKFFSFYLPLIFLTFICGYGVLPTHMSVHHVLAVSTEARRRYQVLWDWNYRIIELSWVCWELNQVL